MPRLVRGGDDAHIAHAAAAILARIRVEDLLPLPGLRQSEQIVVTRHGRHVGEADRGAPGVIPPDPTEDIGLRVIGIDPLEASGIVVALPQCRSCAVGSIDVAHGPCDTGVLLELHEPPGEPRVGVPLRGLCELSAHEEQLAARVCPHVAEVGAQVGELLPAVAGHLPDEGALAVDDLIVGEGQHEVLAVGVHHREGHLIVMPLAMHGLTLDVAEGVVHPPHVPLQAEAEAAQIGRTRHAGPRGGLLGDRDDAGDALVDRGVHLLEECHSVEVLAASVDVGSPLARFTRVVEVEHRGHRVDA